MSALAWYFETPLFILGADLVILVIMFVWLVFFDGQRS